MTEVNAEVVQHLPLELQSAFQAQQQCSELVCALEEERVGLKKYCGMLSTELQILKKDLRRFEKHQTDLVACTQVQNLSEHLENEMFMLTGHIRPQHTLNFLSYVLLHRIFCHCKCF